MSNTLSKFCFEKALIFLFCCSFFLLLPSNFASAGFTETAPPAVQSCQDEDNCLGLCACKVTVADGVFSRKELNWFFYNEVKDLELFRGWDIFNGQTIYEYAAVLNYNKTECSLKITGDSMQSVNNISKGAYALYADQSACIYQKPFCCCVKGENNSLSDCERRVEFKAGTEFNRQGPNSQGAEPVCLSGKIAVEEKPGQSCKELEKLKLKHVQTKEESNAALEKTLSDLNSDAAKKLNFLSYPNIPTLIGQIIVFFLYGIGALSLMFYVYAGVLWMTSAGNSERTQSAKNIFLWTTLGLLATFGSYIVINEVFKFILNTGGNSI